MSVKTTIKLPHLLGIASLSAEQVVSLLDAGESMIGISRQIEKKHDALRGRTLINVFFEPSTRTQASFELAGKRLGADVINMAMDRSSRKKGETLVDTIATLNAMRPDIIVVRHYAAGTANLIARKVNCAVVNAGDGAHEHPTQALLDALTMRRFAGDIKTLKVLIAGDILHSRVARSNIFALTRLGAQVSVFGPPTLIPPRIESLGVRRCLRLEDGLASADVVMMLRLQNERMKSGRVPSTSEYFRIFGLNQDRLKEMKPGALIMHPGPMNRGVEIDGEVADGPRSLIEAQVEMGVAVRMATLCALAP